METNNNTMGKWTKGENLFLIIGIAVIILVRLLVVDPWLAQARENRTIESEPSAYIEKVATDSELAAAIIVASYCDCYDISIEDLMK